MSKEPPFKTVAAMMIGFALGAVGLDSITGHLRLTFGVTELLTGFRLPDRRDRPVRHRRILLSMEEGLGLQGPAWPHQFREVVLRLARIASLLDDIAALVPDRLLDGNFAWPERRLPRS
jgi:hypothetical protein